MCVETLRHFGQHLTSWETVEILKFQQIFYFGSYAKNKEENLIVNKKKITGDKENVNLFNYGFDDENGNYQKG